MASFGEELKRERELRDISLKEISEATNIPARFLEALEQNNFPVLPGGAYTRGFVRSYALHIGVNVEEMVDSYLQELQRQENQKQDQATSTAHQAPMVVKSSALGWFVAAAFLLSAAVIGFIYWRGSERRMVTASDPELSAHSAALKARVKRSGALPSSTPEGSTKPAPPEQEPGAIEPSEPSNVTSESAPQAPPPVERLVRIKVKETTRVTLTCGGAPEYDKDLWVYAERHFSCREPILLGAANGGAVEYSVDSSPFAFLGEPGEIVRDREIGVPPPPTDPNNPASRAKSPPPGSVPGVNRVPAPVSQAAAGTVY